MSFEDRLHIFNKFVQKHSRLPTENDPDYLEMLRMSKYRIMDVPDHPPSKCGNCGSSKNDGRQYIDFGLLIDWYGTVYLCGECLKDIAMNMGLFREIDSRLLDLVVKDEVVIELKEKGADLHERLETLFKEFEAYYAGLHSLGNNSSSDSTTSVVDDETPTVEPRVIEPKPRTTKSTASSGRKDIPSLADLLNANVE